MAEKSEKVRLNKYIAQSGVASRRKADALIVQGQVLVNGKKVYELGVQVDPTKDRVTVQGKPIKPEEEKVYIMFFKPKNVMTTMEDPEGRPTVADYIKDVPYRVYPVGRLEWESEGLLLLTNDGEYANKVMNSREPILKTFLMKLTADLSEEALEKLKNGVPTLTGKLYIDKIEKSRKGTSDTKRWYKVRLPDLKTESVQTAFFKLGYDVEKIQRMAIGGLELKNLRRGEYALLTKKEADRVFEKETAEPKRKTSIKRIVPTATSKSSSRTGAKTGGGHSRRPGAKPSFKSSRR